MYLFPYNYLQSLIFLGAGTMEMNLAQFQYCYEASRAQIVCYFYYNVYPFALRLQNKQSSVSSHD